MGEGKRKFLKYILYGSLWLSIAVLGGLLYYYNLPEKKTNRRIKRARIYQQMGMPHKAIPEFLSALDRYPDSDELHYELARAYFDKRDYDQALSTISPIIEKKPKDPAPYLILRMSVYLAQKKHQTLLEDIITHEKILDSYAEFHWLWADFLLSQWNGPSALPHYQKALNLGLKPDLDRQVRIKMIETMIENKQYQEAESECEIFSAKYEDHMDTDYLLSKICVRRQELDRAEKIWRKILEKKPDHINALLGVAQLRITRKEYREALSDIDQILLYSPDHYMPYYLRGVSYFMLGDDEKALVSLRQSVELYPQFADAHFKLGKLYQKMGVTQQAAAEMTRVIEIVPEADEARLILAGLNLELGWSEGVLEHCEKLLAKQPNHVVALHLYAYALLREERFNESLDVFEKLYKLQSLGKKDMLTLLKFWLVKGEFQKVDDSASQSIREETTDPGYYYVAGMASLAMGDFPRGIYFLEKSLELNSFSSEVRMNLVIARKKLGQYNKAIDTLKEGIKEGNPESDEFSYRLVNSLIDQGRLGEASPYIHDLLEKHPENKKVLLLSARLKVSEKDYESAERIFLDLLKKNPKSMEFHLLLSDVYLAKGELESAVVQLDAAERYSINDALFHELATRYYLAGKQEKSMTLYQHRWLMNPEAKRELLNWIFVKLFSALGDVRVSSEQIKALDEGDFSSILVKIACHFLANDKDGKNIDLINIRKIKNSHYRYLFDDLIRYLSNMKNNRKFLQKILKIVYLNNQGYSDRALKYLESELTKNPECLFARFLKVQILKDASRYESALENALLFSKDASHQNFFLNRAAVIYAKTDRREEAIKLFQKILNMEPQRMDIQEKLAQLLFEAGHHDEARTIYRELIHEKEDSWSLLNNLAWLEMEHYKNYEGAMQLIDEANRLTENNSKILDTRGCIYMNMGNYESAVKDLTAAKNSDLMDITIRVHLVQALAGAGQLNRAKEEGAIICAVWEDSQEAEKIQDLLFRN